MRLRLLPMNVQRWLRERRELHGIPRVSEESAQVLTEQGHELRLMEYRQRSQQMELEEET